MLLLRSTVWGAMSLSLLLPAAADAQKHPRYLRAYADLRAAQVLLRMPDDPAVTRHLKRCEDEVEAAIQEIERAAALDGRDSRKPSPVDPNLERRGRFNRIRGLLETARADIAGETDTPAAARWRNLAFRRIDSALEALRRAQYEAKL